MTKKYKVLAIDDQKDNLITLQAVVKSELPECKLITATSGKDGINLAIKELPDVILLDIIMPGMDGYEVLEALKADYTTSNVPIIMLTAIKTDVNSRIKGLDLGADAFLSKPIDPIELSAQIRVMLRIKLAENKLRLDKKNLEHEISKRIKELKLANERLIIENKERKRTEEQILKLSTAVEQSPSVIVISDLKGNIEYANPKFHELTGYKPEEVIGEKSNILKSGHQDKDFYTELWNTIEAGNEWKGEFHNKRKNGELFWESASISPIKDQNGNITSFIKVAEDITERKLAEEELRKNETLKEVLLNTIPDLVWMKDSQGKYLFCNHKFENFFGASSSEIQGKTDHDFVDKELADFFRKKDLEAIKRGIPSVNEEEVTYANDGHHETLETIKTPVLDTDGSIIGVLGVARDITDRKIEEKVLAVQLKLFEFAQNHSKEELLRKFLDETEKLTASKIGFYHFVEEDQETISLQTWSSNTIGNMCKNKDTAPQHYPISKAGVWVDCVKARKPVIHNDYSILTHKKGLPEGHAPLLRELVVPVIRGNKIVAILGVGNKETEYDEKDIKIVQQLADLAWETIVRKKAEAKLKQTEDNYSKLFNLSRDGYVINKGSGELLSPNPAYCRMLGYSEEEIQNVTWKDITPKKWLDWELATHGKQLVDRGYTDLYEKEYIRKDGSVFPIQIQAFLLNKPEKLEDSLIAAFVRDITEQKTNEEALIESERKYRSLVDNLPVGVFRSTLNGQVTSANKAMADIYGYDSVDELLAVPAANYYDKQNPRSEMIKILKKDGYLIEKVTLENRKDGSKIWVSANYKAIQNSDGQIEFIDGVVIDISARKKAEEKIQQQNKELITVNEELIISKEKAEESDRLKSAFLATMSHELRTPLNAIIGFSEIIKDDYSVEDIKSFNEHIHTSGTHLLNIVEELFDIALIEAGEVNVSIAEEKLSELLDNVFQIVKAEQIAQNKEHLDLTLEIPEDLKHQRIHTDGSKFKQIFINLLKNAVKFTHEGFIRFGCEIIEEESSKIRFYVKDSGIGIAKEKFELIFDIFRQVEDSHTRVYGGTGIGLTITKKLINILGSEIHLDSELNKGTTFYFDITVSNKPKQGIESGKTHTSFDHYPTADLNIKSKILVVEDVEASYEYLKVILNQANIQTAWAKTGVEAIKKVEQNNSFDLILMDINMPEMNGYDATRRIKEIKPELPIIAQTAYAIAGDKEKAFESGCDDYIAKPIKKDELLNKIQAHLQDLS